MGLARTITTAAALLCLSYTAAAASELRMLMSWDESYTAVPLIPYEYVKAVEEASGGETTIQTVGPEAVPPFEQLQPLSAGVFDLLFTHGGYHSGDTGLGSAMDAIDGDPDRRRESGVWDYLDKHYQENFGLKLISIPTALTGFQLLLREPLDEDGKLTGRKIRGTAVYHGLIEALGGSPVVLPAGEMYAAAEKGVVDGIAWPAVGAIGFKLCEVTPYMVRPTYGRVSYLILMNLDSFDNLSEEEQTLLLEQGEELEKKTVTAFKEALAEEDAAMKECGGEIVHRGPEWEDFANEHFSAKAWALAAEASGEAAEEFEAFAREQGMTP